MRRSIDEARATSMLLIVQAEACVATAAALCGDAAGLRTQARAIRTRQTGSAPRGSNGIVSFSLDGVIDDRIVHAEWREGRLVADPLLLERAVLVVGLGERFITPGAASLAASLTGPPITGLLTLIRACDRVRQIDVVSPACPPGRSRAGP